MKKDWGSVRRTCLRCKDKQPSRDMVKSRGSWYCKGCYEIEKVLGDTKCIMDGRKLIQSFKDWYIYATRKHKKLENYGGLFGVTCDYLEDMLEVADVDIHKSARLRQVIKDGVLVESLSSDEVKDISKKVNKLCTRLLEIEDWYDQGGLIMWQKKKSEVEGSEEVHKSVGS